MTKDKTEIKDVLINLRITESIRDNFAKAVGKNMVSKNLRAYMARTIKKSEKKQPK